MTPFRVICLDSSNKPESIPTSKWVKTDEIYTVVQVDRLNMQNGTLGYKLYELDIDGYFPYQYFGAWRFGIVITDKNEAEIEEMLNKLLEEAEKEDVELKQHAQLKQ